MFLCPSIVSTHYDISREDTLICARLLISGAAITKVCDSNRQGKSLLNAHTNRTFSKFKIRRPNIMGILFGLPVAGLSY